MASVEFRNISKVFGTNTIVPGLNLKIDSGEFVALVGPSGCGKSTCLRMLAGLEEPTTGSILIDEQDVTDVSPKNRGVSMVFQSYALYPHMTVHDNLAFPLKMAKLASKEIEARIMEVAAMLDLGELLARKPAQLSGGQKQRVAMGRALVRKPQVLLFDEPLSNLDAQLRVRVRSEIAALHERIKSTIVYVTHDQVEAMTLADRIAILNKGSLEQAGAPLEVYGRPRTRFVASFIGTPPMNFVKVSTLRGVPVPGGTAIVGFRPEATEIEGTESSSLIKIGNGRVTLVEPLGSTTHIHLRLGDDAVIAESRGVPSQRLGDELAVRTEKSSLFFFNVNGTRIETGV
jgi:ABC-type sugar transport system ATPase subunit